MEKKKKNGILKLDWMTIIIVLVLVGIGLISLASIMASPFSGDEASIGDYINKLNLEYVEKQIVNFLIGLAAAIVITVIDYEIYKDVIKYVYWANVAILLLLIIAGKSTRGILGWITVGSRAFQPAEVCKITLIIFMSNMVSQCMDKDGRLHYFKDIFKILVYIGIPTGLVLLQPDFGTAFVYICIMVVIFFIAKIDWKYILGAAAGIGAFAPIAYFFLLSEEQQGRINVFLDPELDVQGKGYNVIQSKVSIGSGQIFGKGFFSSGTLAQLKYVPERHTDFIFAGIAEGVGFVGGTIIICLYFILIFRWLYVALKAKDNFGMCIVIGAMGMLLAHVFENIGMTMGLMPVTGIPLPFISYGGSNLLTNMMAVGLVMNVYLRRQSKKHYK